MILGGGLRSGARKLVHELFRLVVLGDRRLRPLNSSIWSAPSIRAWTAFNTGLYDSAALRFPATLILTRRSQEPNRKIGYDAGMGVELLTERHKRPDRWLALSCYDRIIIQGTVPGWCYASGMTGYFYAHEMRIFDYPKWAQPLREALRANMERVAAENGIEIEFVRSRKSFRKEGRVKEVLSNGGASGRSVHSVGNGTVRQLQALA